MKITGLVIFTCFCFRLSSQNVALNFDINNLYAHVTNDTNFVKSVTVILRDSVTHKPLKNQHLLYFYRKNLTRTDSAGKIIIKIGRDSVMQVISENTNGYYRKTISVNAKKRTYFIDAVPFHAAPERSFSNPGKVKDTSYYSGKKLQKIRYLRDGFINEVTYYETGNIKSELICGDLRERYEDGTFKNYTIYITEDLRTEGNYYPDGKIKATGSFKRMNDPKTGKKIWIKNKDWKNYPPTK